jgi:hypothetical protein
MATATKNGATATKKGATHTTIIELPKLNIKTIEMRIEGLSPLISHRWSEKSRKEMADNHGHVPRQAKGARDPEQEYEDSLYVHQDGGFGFPAGAFKESAVSAVSQISGLTKVFTRGAFHVNLGQELVQIEGEPRMREDMVRIGMGTADLRYRGEFETWAATLRVSYNAQAISPGQIANLFNTAGFAVGVGEWRPEKDGSYGMFGVV